MIAKVYHQLQRQISNFGSSADPLIRRLKPCYSSSTVTRNLVQGVYPPLVGKGKMLLYISHFHSSFPLPLSPSPYPSFTLPSLVFSLSVPSPFAVSRDLGSAYVPQRAPPRSQKNSGVFGSKLSHFAKLQLVVIPVAFYWLTRTSGKSFTHPFFRDASNASAD